MASPWIVCKQWPAFFSEPLAKSALGRPAPILTTDFGCVLRLLLWVKVFDATHIHPGNAKLHGGATNAI